MRSGQRKVSTAKNQNKAVKREARRGPNTRKITISPKEPIGWGVEAKKPRRRGGTRREHLLPEGVAGVTLFKELTIATSGKWKGRGTSKNQIMLGGVHKTAVLKKKKE